MGHSRGFFRGISCQIQEGLRGFDGTEAEGIGTFPKGCDSLKNFILSRFPSYGVGPWLPFDDGYLTVATYSKLGGSRFGG